MDNIHSKPSCVTPVPPSRMRVPAKLAGLRAEALLAIQFPFLSRTRIRQKIQGGESLLNGRRYASSARVREGDEIAVFWRRTPEAAPAEGLDLPILFEDEHLLAVDKPAGVAVHPTGKIQSGTVIQFARAKLAAEVKRSLEKGDGGFYPGLVNRLDFFTSGVVLIAKSRTVLLAMQDLAARGAIGKRYTAVVEGRVERDRGRIELAIGPDPHSRIGIKMAVRPDGLPSKTEYEVVRRAAECTLLHAMPLTGRQHQVRVHLAAIGHPVWGDLLYKDETLFLRYWENGSVLDESLPPRHLLHAGVSSFVHPVTGEAVQIEAPVPREFEGVLGGER